MKALRAWLLILAFTTVHCASQAASNDPALIVEDVRCRGNASTSCDFILGHLYLSAGDVLNEEEIQNAKLRLSTLRTFESVDIYLEKGSDRGRAVVVVEVIEANPIAAEWLIGASSRLDAQRQVLAGRLMHQNLFGAGKFADFSVLAVYPLNGPSEEDYGVAFRYADPQLFGSKRYFGIASVGYRNDRFENRYGSFSEHEALRLGVTLGRRLWDFSYVTVGYGYRALLEQRSGHWQSDGTFELDEDKNRHVMDVVYGWNSEDDLYFPTRGSSFHIGGGWNFGAEDDSDEFHLQFRKTWQGGSGLWTFKLGGDPNPEYRQSFNESQLLSVTYARELAGGDAIHRGRWYIEPGYNEAGFTDSGRRIRELGVKAGVRMEVQGLGLVDLYVMGTGDPRR